MSTPLHQHILLPLPSLQTLSSASATREDKLAEIISNIEKQQHQVKNNIIASAKLRLDSLLDEDEDDLRQLRLDSLLDEDEDEDMMDIDEEEDETTATELFVTNLSAPYIEGSGDPCSTNRPPKPAPGIRQAAPPPQIEVAKEALDEIDAYELHAGEARKYYLQALERRKSSAGLTTYPAADTTANASPIDPSRDPRRRPR